MEQKRFVMDDFKPIMQRMELAGMPGPKVMQELSFAVQVINKTPKLRECTVESVLQSVMNIANIGLSLNPAAKEAFLIPRWNNYQKKMIASLDPSYIGLVKLLTDSGSISAILAQLVYENDHFVVDLANNVNPVTHRPLLERSKRGNIIGVYALATLQDGTRQVEYMSKEEAYEIRERSESYIAFKEGKMQTCTWMTDEGEMIRKTVLKRIYKYLPRTERMERIDEAVSIDNSDYTASEDQLSYIESLLHTCSLEQRQVDAIQMEMAVMNGQRASEVIQLLKLNQIPDEREELRLIQRRPVS